MNSYSILLNRKRAIIALVHSIFFLIIALMSFLGKPKAGVIFAHGTEPRTDLAMIGIYLVVTAILVALVRASSCFRERLYFAFCVTSASFGFLRITLGDTHLFIAQYVRVGMLGCAVLTGYLILRSHSRSAIAKVAIGYSE